MKTFDKTVAQKLREELQSAVEAVAKKHEIEIVFGRCGYSPTEMNYKVTVTTKDTEVLEKKNREDFDNYAKMFGFEKDDYRKVFEVRGIKYTLEGFALSRSKFNVRGKAVDSGKEMLFVDFQIARKFHPEKAVELTTVGIMEATDRAKKQKKSPCRHCGKADQGGGVCPSCLLKYEA